jgi:hypothetical protein
MMYLAGGKLLLFRFKCNKALHSRRWNNGTLCFCMKGTLPRAVPNRPNTALTRNLLDDAKERFPRLKWDLTEVGLWNFLTDEDTIGIPCTKYRANFANGWSFAPLDELREAWVRRYGPVKWHTEVKEWSKKGKMEG